MDVSPLIALNNDTKMPTLGLGVLDRSTRELTTSAVEAAIASGYRLIDTAASYLNERHVGKGLARSGIARSEVLVTTKLWLREYGYNVPVVLATRACAGSGSTTSIFILHGSVGMFRIVLSASIDCCLPWVKSGKAQGDRHNSIASD